ncbi:MAG TPA: VCBS repeat-containing protein, partial [Candidatus Binatia bacterium]|nr:VCBS repeat-containing protein [Candidatus Binatia bacterium]
MLVCLAQFAATASDWESHAGYRERALDVTASGATGFALVDPAIAGITFTNVLSDQALMMDSSLLSGSGVALGDIDGDGLCDFYFCNLAGRNALYRNLGHWHFEEIAEKAGVACPGQVSRGAVIADVDGNGTLDLLVTGRGGGVRCFLNDGTGNFHERTAEAGLATNTGSLSLALADVNGDGSLDLYVANFGVGSVLRDGGNISTRMINGKLVVVGRMAKRVKIIKGKFVEFGEPDVLYLNDGHGHFRAVPWEKGAFLDEKGKPSETPMDFGLSVQMRDLNGDGSPDIYVCNDFFTPDRIWINDGHGNFRAIATLAIRKSSYAAMGIDFADIDRDGHPDALIVEMLSRDPALRLRQMSPDVPTAPVIGDLESRPQTGRNTLLWNRGDGTFAEIAHFAGLAASDWSWTPIFLDVDLDGFEDVLISTGAGYDLLDADMAEKSQVRDPRISGQGTTNFPRIETPNCAFRNQGNRTFTECGKAWGFNSTRISNGMALADLDNDGALDVIVNCLNAPPLVYRNLSGAPRVAIRLKGLSPNTQGIGSLVIVHGGAVPMQSQEIIS